MPKLIALARRRRSGVHVVDGDAEHLRGRGGVDVDAVREGLLAAAGCRRCGPAGAARSGCSRRRSDCGPAAAMKAVRILRPASVRIGMFCRFGSERGQAAGGGRRPAGRRCGRGRLRGRMCCWQGVGIGAISAWRAGASRRIFAAARAGLGQLVEQRRRRSPTGRTASSWRRAGPSCRTGCRRSASGEPS